MIHFRASAGNRFLYFLQKRSWMKTECPIYFVAWHNAFAFRSNIVPANFNLKHEFFCYWFTAFLISTEYNIIYAMKSVFLLPIQKIVILFQIVFQWFSYIIDRAHQNSPSTHFRRANTSSGGLIRILLRLTQYGSNPSEKEEKLHMTCARWHVWNMTIKGDFVVVSGLKSEHI